MLILSIDSSQPVGSVTLARAGGASFEVVETAQAPGKFSAQLIPTLRRLLGDHGIGKSQIDVLAAASGPGTFTGLRVGLAAVKALAETLHKPIVTVSVLEALAFGQNEVITVTEAGKGFWYVGAPSNGMLVERHLSTEQLRELFSRAPDARLATTATLPDGMHGDRVSIPVSELVARVAAAKAMKNQFADLDLLDANYVRSDEGLYRTS